MQPNLTASPEDPGREARERMLRKVIAGLAACAELMPRRPDAYYWRARALYLLENETEAVGEALKEADQALYAAKHAGRDRVERFTAATS